MPPTGSRGIAYLRVSQDRQDHQRQVEDVQRYALKHKLTFMEIIEDAGSRLEAEKRKDFQRLRKMVENKEVDWVLLQTADRLGFKHTLEFFSFLWEFKNSGVELWSAIEDRNLVQVDDGTVFRNVVAGQTSAKELFEKANRAQSSRVVRGRQGKFMGGLPPYGFDVVCFDHRGEEQWRFILTGRRQGRQIFANGVEVEVKGVPKHNKEIEDCYLRPSLIEERVKTLKWLFETFDSQSISSLGLAKELNDRKIDPILAPYWKHDTIWLILQNSAVIGRPASNKVTSAKLMEYKDGELKERESADAGQYERRYKDQWIMPDKPIFDPLIPEEVFWRVIEKIMGGRKKRAPRNSQLWLAGLVVCGRCGQTMRGSWKEDYSNGKGRGTFRAKYFCQTRQSLGPNNPTGCRHQGTRQSDLETLVLQFLEDRGEALEDLLSAKGDRSRLVELLNERREAGAELADLYARMRSWLVDEIEGQGASSLVSIPEDNYLLEDMYSQLFEDQTRDLERRLKTLNDKHETIMEGYFELPPKAQSSAKRKLAEIESEMEELEARLQPLSHAVEEKREAWSDLGRKIRAARAAILEGDLREKAEAVRGAIDRIELHFEDEGPRNSRLVKVVISPISGVSSEVSLVDSCYRNLGTHCFLADLLTRVCHLQPLTQASP